MGHGTADQSAILERHYPSTRADPPTGTFEIAIVLAGAVSAGSYSAGVMDFLIEALDTWEAAKAADRAEGVAGTHAQRVPHHRVILKAIAGSSAGGMNGAIAATALSTTFPHVCLKTDAATAVRNPFYNAWVQRIDIEHLLNNTDLLNRTKGLPLSLLNCKRLTDIADGILRIGVGMESIPSRPWLADPFELRLTNTNLNGVPFGYELKSDGLRSNQQTFRMHADQVAFAICRSAEGAAAARPDCLTLRYDEARTTPAWQLLSRAALATGAFPVALEARDISIVDASVYQWRFSFHDVDLKADVSVPPVWGDNGAPTPFKYAAVDGGVMNNEPFEIARTVLAGPRGRNKQAGDEANRAVIVIDPLVDAPEAGPEEKAGVLTVLERLLPIQVNQARLSAQDFVQIQRGDIYSRFMIMPKRSENKHELFGTEALATGELGAFGGFFCEKYRHHDYMLGRRNAQRFLQTAFTLPADNKLFCGGRWSADNLRVFRDVSSDKQELHLQIIPLCGDLRNFAEALEDWPRFAYTSDRRAAIRQLIEARMKRLWPLAMAEAAGKFAGKREAPDEEQPWTSRLWSSVVALGVRAYVGIGWLAGRGSLFALIDRKIGEAIEAIEKRDTDGTRSRKA